VKSVDELLQGRAGRHASWLELDRILLGLDPDGETAQHLAGCERCRTDLEGARAQRAALSDGAQRLPDWVMVLAGETPSALASHRPRAARRAGSWRATVGKLLLAAALASVGLVLSVSSRQGEGSEGAYVAAKGAPTVAVYVKRDGRVFTWDGVEKVRAGDGIRLAIAGAGYRFVGVLARMETGLVTLYRGELRGPSELPVAWTVDGDGDAERLVVVLSNRPLSDSELAARDRQRAGDGTWLHELVLPKAGGEQP
jgi:hypothetical protein